MHMHYLGHQLQSFQKQVKRNAQHQSRSFHDFSTIEEMQLNFLLGFHICSVEDFQCQVFKVQNSSSVQRMTSHELIVREIGQLAQIDAFPDPHGTGPAKGQIFPSGLCPTYSCPCWGLETFSCPWLPLHGGAHLRESQDSWCKHITYNTLMAMMLSPP